MDERERGLLRGVTHYADEHTLERLRRLEDVAEAARRVIRSCVFAPDDDHASMTLSAGNNLEASLKALDKPYETVTREATADVDQD